MIDDLTKELSRSPTIKELSEALEIDSEEIIHALEATRFPKSIHETVFENEGEPITLLDQIPEEETNWFHKLTLEEAIRDLRSEERRVGKESRYEMST